MSKSSTKNLSAAVMRDCRPKAVPAAEWSAMNRMRNVGHHATWSAVERAASSSAAKVGAARAERAAIKAAEDARQARNAARRARYAASKAS